MVETKRRFLTHTLPGLLLAACMAEASPQGDKRIKLARSMQISSGESMIPMPNFIEELDVTLAVTSFGTGRIEINLTKDEDGLIFPSLVEGEIASLNPSNNPQVLSKVKVKMGNKFWIFETAGEVIPKKVGDKIKLGDPMFKLDFSKYSPAAGDGYEKPLMFIRAVDEKNRDKEELSRIGRANILKNPDNTYVTIPVLPRN